MKRKIQLAKLNRPNGNRRIYTEACFKNLPERLDVTIGLVEEGQTPEVIGNVTDFKVEGDWLTANLELNVKANIYKELSTPEILATMAFVPCGYGELKDSVVQEGYVMTYVAMIDSKNSAFNETPI
jgi:hypothetical protein